MMAAPLGGGAASFRTMKKRLAEGSGSFLKK
jgi:hypothetical protein